MAALQMFEYKMLFWLFKEHFQNNSLILHWVFITQPPMEVGLTIYYKLASSTPKDALWPILIDEIGLVVLLQEVKMWKVYDNAFSFGKLKCIWLMETWTDLRKKVIWNAL